MRRTRRYFPSQSAYNFGGVRVPGGIRVPVGGRVRGGESVDDIVDSPDWDTYPVSGLPTNWSIRNGEYTLEGPSVPDQIIAYRDIDASAVDISMTVLNAFTSNTQADNFLSCRISDTENYIGCRYNQNGFIVSQVNGGVITNFSTLLVTPPFTIRLVAQSESLKVYYNGSLSVDVTTDVVQSGRVGIVARNNESAVPLAVFKDYQVQFSADADDIADLPDWDTIPSGQSTVWGRYSGVYTLRGSTSPRQAITYLPAGSAADLQINARMLNYFTAPTTPDHFLALRISDADNWVGVRWTVNGISIAECIGGNINTLHTRTLSAGTYNVRFYANGPGLGLEYLDPDQDWRNTYVATSQLNPGYAGIIARPNASQVPRDIFDSYVVGPFVPA